MACTAAEHRPEGRWCIGLASFPFLHGTSDRLPGSGTNVSKGARDLTCKNNPAFRRPSQYASTPAQRLGGPGQRGPTSD